MRKQWKGFVLGVLVTVFVMVVSMPAYAAVRQIAANYAGVKITLDGVKIVPKDANGKAVEPFISEGTTYLPIRGVASALGLDVDWDQKTKTVILTSSQVTPDPTPTPAPVSKYQQLANKVKALGTVDNSATGAKKGSTWVTQKYAGGDLEGVGKIGVSADGKTMFFEHGLKGLGTTSAVFLYYDLSSGKYYDVVYSYTDDDGKSEVFSAYIDPATYTEDTHLNFTDLEDVNVRPADSTDRMMHTEISTYALPDWDDMLGDLGFTLADIGFAKFVY